MRRRSEVQKVGVIGGVVVLLMLAAAGCGGPGPEAPREATAPSARATTTAISVPAASPTTTPTSTPAPPAALRMDESTLGREVLGALAAAERSCIREELGEEAFEGLHGQRVLNSHDWFNSLPIDCLAEETAIELSIALVASATGGLSADSQRCLGEVYASSGAIGLGYGLRSTFPSSNEPEAIRFVLRFVLCLTDEEAEAHVEQPGGWEAFGPSGLRCLLERLDFERFVSFLHGLTEDAPGQPPSESEHSLEEVFSANEACGGVI